MLSYATFDTWYRTTSLQPISTPIIIYIVLGSSVPTMISPPSGNGLTCNSKIDLLARVTNGSNPWEVP